MAICGIVAVAVIAVLVHDAGRSDRVADGVRVGGVDVGGMSRAQARRAVSARYASAVPDAPWAGKLAGRVIPPGDPQNPLAARWMGFHDGAGIHGTKDLGSLGSAASHGCVRMAIPDVKRLYRRVKVGTPVFIA